MLATSFPTSDENHAAISDVLTKVARPHVTAIDSDGGELHRDSWSRDRISGGHVAVLPAPTAGALTKYATCSHPSGALASMMDGGRGRPSCV